MVDILISGGTIITMDPQRRIIEDGAVAIEEDLIVDVGIREEVKEKFSADIVIDASMKVVMPGLFDGHGHAGHSLLKSLGYDYHPSLRHQACEVIYSQASSEDFWKADSLLTNLERLKFGTTCGVTLFGGGLGVMRSDDPMYGDRHCEALEKVGVREFLAVGPRSPPFPKKYSRWVGEARRDYMVSFEDQMKTSEKIIERWHGKGDGRINIAMMFVTPHPEVKPFSHTEFEDLKYQSNIAQDLCRKYGLIFHMDGHSRGTVKFCHEELGILGPEYLLNHSVDFTAEEIGICKKLDIKISHSPSAIRSMTGRCPVPELIDAGVTVVLGSDGVSPDRSYDMFRHMFVCGRYHRRYYRDERVLPPGKILEMVTIDGAKALGLEKELGSIEVGKKADVILVDMYQPHMYPFNMPVDRVTCFANGNDVDTVIVDGKILMENRVVKTVDEAEVLDLAQQEIETAVGRSKLKNLYETPETFWRHSKY